MTCDPLSDHQVDSTPPGAQPTRVPPSEQEPPRDATLAKTASDKHVDPSLTSDPPASDKPVKQNLPASTSTGPTESTLETATQVEHDPTPPMDTNSPSVVTDTSTHSMDAFPNLDQYFGDPPPPPTNLRPHPETRISSSTSQSPSFRTKRSGGGGTKEK